ncbi:MAG: AraC family transcriptional regulator [Anaeromicrobium sp.]|jgi:serine kinase of HPr protein (carbohydrate metabolism regulator)|uniref:AraC family transcriptional regulator n=1 Tax=Anaeromicrobium sp. TaxID=1929132 RepID=UPI0025CD4BCB|nr:AraC family transcriptional regulator [Anaeromicrobium sp.]MCT4594933.1 AraC family transcriptional regulator [Anaeromicrobium sp.]
MMKVKELIKDEMFKLITNKETANKIIEGVYCCDLLSWVMSNGKINNVWITVQTHMNIIAVASLLELSCIIVPENIEVEEETIKKANEENISILSTSLPAYEIFKKLYELGIK